MRRFLTQRFSESHGVSHGIPVPASIHLRPVASSAQTPILFIYSAGQKTEHLLEIMSLDVFENIKLLRTVLSASYFFTLKAMGPGRRLLGLREIAKCMSAVLFLNMWT